MAIRDIIDEHETHAIYSTADGSSIVKPSDFWQVLGFITNPAVILQNMATGEKITEVIGYPSAERYHRIIIEE